MEQVAIFIDGNNLYHIIKSMFRSHVKMMDFNFIRFLEKISKNQNIKNIYYYNAPLDRKKNPEAYAKQQKFFEKIKKIPNFKLMLCRMQKVKINNKTIYQVKEDYIHLAVDMVKLAYSNAYDKAILVSSDGDFVPVVKAIQEIGKNVENVGFDIKFSHHLKQECDSFTLLKKHEIIKMFDDFKISPKK